MPQRFRYQLSIVIPVLNEALNLPPLVEKIRASLDSSALRYEVIFVDDGSRDESFEVIQKIHQVDARFKGLRFLRNQGKSEAYMAGFEYAQGEFVGTMDGDMQDDPADLLRLMEEVQRGHDMAIGWKRTGKSTRSTFYLSKLFNAGIRFFSKTTLHDLNCPLRVMRQVVAKNLYIYASLHRYIPILVASQGFQVTEVVVGNYERLHGSSNYKFSKYLESLFDLMTVLFVTYYRKKPLQFLGPIGLFSFSVGFGIDAYYLLLSVLEIEKLRNNIPSLLLGIALIMIGVQIILTGLMGEMISRELGSAQKRQPQLIKEGVGFDEISH